MIYVTMFVFWVCRFNTFIKISQKSPIFFSTKFVCQMTLGSFTQHQKSHMRLPPTRTSDDVNPFNKYLPVNVPTTFLWGPCYLSPKPNSPSTQLSDFPRIRVHITRNHYLSHPGQKVSPLKAVSVWWGRKVTVNCSPSFSCSCPFF